MIWFKSVQLIDLQGFDNDSLGKNLGMEFVGIGADFLKMKMPVDHRTKQPFGLLHGGASVALAETLGSVASTLVVDSSKFICVGLEINANHVRGVTQGFVTGICTPIHLGRKTHVWDIKIYDESEKLCCVSRLTVAILNKP